MSRVIDFIKQSRGLTVLALSMVISFVTTILMIVLAAAFTNSSPTLTLLSVGIGWLVLSICGIAWWVGLIMFIIEQSKKKDIAEGIPTR